MVAGGVHLKRECYSLSGAGGQTKETPCIGSRSASKLGKIVAARERELEEGVRDPRGLITLPPERHGREIRRIGFDEQPVSRDESDEIVVSPLVEGDDPAE